MRSRIKRLRARRVGRTSLTAVSLLLAGSVLGVTGGLISRAQVGDVTSIVVRFNAGVTAEQEQASVAAVGGAISSDIPVLRMAVVDVPAGQESIALAALRSDPSVQSADLDRPREAQAIPNDPDYASQWALGRIGWDQVYGSATLQGVSTIAVLDTGVAASDADLAGRIVQGWSAFGTDPAVDVNGHGTAMASIAASVTNNGLGVAGVAYGNVQIMPVQVLDATGVGQDSDIIQGVVWAVDHGADVVLMAFSSPGYSSALQDAITYAWNRGAVLVAAVGNDASSASQFPAADAKVVGVSATDSSDAFWPSSNSGSSVFMAAPGVNVASSSGSVTGTSASSALVAGAAALLRSIDPTASNGVVVGRLARSADPMGNTALFGNGILDLAGAVADGGTTPVVPVGGAPVGDGGPYVTYTAALKWAASCGGGVSSRTVTVSAATDLVSLTAHGYVAGDVVYFPTLAGGTGLTANTVYYVVSGSVTTDAFKVSTTAAGAAINVTADTTSATLASAAAISAATDVVTMVGHGLSAGDPVIFNTLTNGAPLAVSTVYYVAAPVTTNSFKVVSSVSSATAIDVTSNGTGTPGGWTPTTSATASYPLLERNANRTITCRFTQASGGSATTFSWEVRATPTPTGGATQATLGAACGVSSVDVVSNSGAGVTGNPLVVSIQLCGDAVREEDQQFDVFVSAGADTTATVTVTLFNDDGILYTVSDQSQSEASNFSYTITKDGGGAGSVTLSTADISPTASAVGVASCPSSPGSAGSDYASVSQSVSFAATEQQKTVSIPVCPDLIDEPNETFQVSLSSPVASLSFQSASSVGSSGTATITDDDAAPNLAISSPSVTEGTGNSDPLPEADLNFVISVSPTAGNPTVSSTFAMSVAYATVDGTATAGSDYASTSGTLSWSAADVTSRTVTVKVIGDAVQELNETVLLRLSSPSNASLASTPLDGTGTILNDDSGVTYAVACQVSPCETKAEDTSWTASIGTLATTQGNAAATDTTLSLTLGAGVTLPPSGAPFYILVESEIERVTAWSAPVAPATAHTLTVVRAQAGTAVARHAVSGGSTITVYMPGGSASNASTYGLKITATGNVAGTVKYETVADTRVGARSATVGAAGASCAQGIDVVYAGATDTPLSLAAPGLQNFTVTICRDGVFEFDETFAIKVYDAATAVAGASASPTSTPTYLYLTITNDELTPSIVVADATPTVEGNSGSTNHAFTVTRWGPSEVTTDATYAVTGSGTYAAAAADFAGAALPSGSITQIGASYAASASVTVNVPVAGDTAPESPETYTLTLSGVSPATSATLLDATGLGTILNDDTQVSITAQNGAGLLEGQTYAYLLELSNVGGGGSYTSVTGVQMTYTVTGGSGLVSGATCTGTVDVTPATSTLTMSSSSDYVYIPLCSDVTAEADESVTVTFAPTNAVLSGAATRTFSIYDDDKTIAVKTLQDANANGIDNADAALGGVTVDIYVDGTDTDGTGANGSFDAASDYLLSAKRVVTSTAAKTLGTGTFSGLRNLTYFVVETDPTATYADISSTAALCGGTQSGTAAAAITAAATSISVTETVNPGTLPRNLCIDSELVTLTARSGDVNPRTYTVTRGVAGSVAAAHLSGAIVTTTMSTPVTGLAAPYANNTVKVTFDPTTAAVAGATTPVRFLDARKIASVSGSVLHDTDASGVIERTETEVIEGAALTLFRDSNGNGTFEPGSDSSLDAVTGLPLETTSDAFGAFSFENLLAGTYFIVETDLSTPSVYGSTAVSPTQGATPPWTGLAAAYRFNVIKVTLASGTGSSSGNQFLDSVAGGTIAGRVLDDVDASSTESAGDTALGSNVSVVLYRDQNGNGTLEPASDLVYDSANTMSAYSFGAIMQGTYFLVETDLAGYASTTAIVGTGTGAVSSIPAGLVAPDLNNEIKIVVTSPTATSSENLFLDSLANASIGVSVFDDTNVDGILDVTETTNVSGATVKLYRDNPIVAAGNVGTFNVATDFLVDTKTTAGAALSFTGLVKGTYFIVETNVATWTSTGVVANAAAGASTDGDNDRIKVAITALNLASTGSAFLDALATGTITGFVNEDVNNNAAYDVSVDRTLASATVTLYRDGGAIGSGDGLYGAGDVQVGAPVTTAAAGTFSFGSLLRGTYFVVETDPADFTSTNALAGSGANSSATPVGTGQITVVVSLAGGSSATNRFLDHSNWTISGSVVNDANANGIVDAGEAGRGGVTVTLYASDGSTVLETKTSRATAPVGAFGFGDTTTTPSSALATGTYYIEVTPTAASGHWQSTGLVLGGGATQDTSTARYSVVIDATGVTAGSVIQSSGSQFLTTRDDYEITGSIINDADANRVQNGAETTLTSPGVTVTLYRDNPSAGTVGALDVGTDPVVGTSVDTTGTGTFSFGYAFNGAPGAVTAGTYFLKESGIPGGWSATNALPGTLANVTNASSSFAAVTGDFTQLKIVIVATGANKATATGGRFLLADASRGITAYAIDDLDADGVVDMGEPALAGVSVELWWDNPQGANVGIYGTGDIQIGTTFTTVIDGTANDGRYASPGLVQGTYFLRRTANPVAPTLYLSSGSSADAGFGGVATIDQLTLTLPSTTAATSTANYILAGAATASVTGTVYNDEDGSGSVTTYNGTLETGKSGVVVTIVRSGGLTYTATTDASGVYTRSGLLAGSYTVTLLDADLPAGWVRTPVGDPSFYPRAFTLTTGQTLVESPAVVGDPASPQLFLRAKNASISGSLYGDLDGSGTYAKSAGDTLLAGVTVVAFTDTSGDGDYQAGTDQLIATTTTNATGAFQLSSLYAGTYKLTYVWDVTPAFANYVTVVGKSKVLTVSPLASSAVAGQNFFTQPGSTISGSAWIDKNADGLRGASSTALPGVVVTLYREAGGTATTCCTSDVVIGTATSAADGSFSFTGLNSKKSGGIVYYLRQTTIPATYSFTSVIEGTGTTAVTTPLTNQEIKVTFTASNSTSANNYVLDTRNDGVTVSGTTVVDTNANGVDDAGTKLAGATVTLYLDDGGTPNALDGTDTQIYAITNAGTGARTATATTDANGVFTFSGLPTGTYFVVETDPASPKYTSTNAIAGTGTGTTADIPEGLTGANLNNQIRVSVADVAASNTGNTFLDTRDDNATISGTVYEDTNGDGVVQSNTLFPNARIQIYLDNGSTAGSLDATDTLLWAKVNGTSTRAASWTTTATGTFSLAGLPNNATFFVVQTPPSPCTKGSDCYSQSKANRGNDSANVTTTAPSAAYVGRDVLKVVVGNTSSATSSTNQFLNTRDDGDVVTGAIYDDLNGTGAYDTGDLGLANAVVKIYRDQAGVGTWDGAATEFQMKAAAGTTITGVAPTFTFSQLPEGLYWVTVSVPANYLRTGANLGTYGSLDPASTDTLRVWKIDLRFSQTGAYDLTSTSTYLAALGNNSVSGFSWYDLNGDGLANSKGNRSDGKLEGTKVYLYKDDPNATGAGTTVGQWDASDTLVTTTSSGAALTNPVTTPASGVWSFTNLPPGVYFARQVAPSTVDIDYIPTGPLTQKALTDALAACGTSVASSGTTYLGCTPINEVGSYPKHTYLRIVLPGTAQATRSNLPFLSQSGDLTIAIDDAIATVVAGDDTTYTVTVSNVGGGTAPATTSTTTVSMPTGITYASVKTGPDFTCTFASPTLTCENAVSIARDASASFEVTVHVDTDYAGTSLVMNASTSASDYDFNTTNDCTASNGSCYNVVQTGTNPDGTPIYSNVPIYPDTDTVTRTAPLTISTAAVGLWAANPTGFAAGEVVAGTDLRATVTVTNAGPSAAAVKVVTSFRDAGTGYTGGEYCVETTPATCLTTGTWTAIPSSGSASSQGIVFQATIPGQTQNAGGKWVNNVTRTIYIRASVDPSATAGSTLVPSQTMTTTTTGASVTGSPSATSLSVITRADVQVALSAAPTPTVLAGNTLTYSVAVTNAGPSDAQAVDVTSSIASLTGGSPGPTISGVKYCSYVPPASPCSLGGSPSSWSSLQSFGAVAPGTTTYKVVAPIPSDTDKGSTVTGAFTVGSTTTDWATGNETVSSTIDVDTRSDLSVTVTPSAVALAGTWVTYTVTVTNDGPSDARGVQLSALAVDPLLLSPTACVGSACDPSAAGASSLSSVLAGLPGSGVPSLLPTTNSVLKPTGLSPSTWVIKVRGRVASSALPADGPVDVSATTLTTTQDDYLADQSDVSSTAVTTSADVQVEMSSDPVEGGGPIRIEEPVVYTITVTNVGPSYARSVTFADTLPARLVSPTFVSVKADGVAVGTNPCAFSLVGSPAASKLSCTFGDVGDVPSADELAFVEDTVPATTYEIVVKAFIDPVASYGSDGSDINDTMVNTAQVHQPGPAVTSDPVSANDADTVTLGLVQRRFTTLTYTTVIRSADYSDVLTFQAHLAGDGPDVNRDGQPDGVYNLSGREVTFDLDCGGDWKLQAKGTTNASGYVTASTNPITFGKAVCDLTYSWPGDSTYFADADELAATPTPAGSGASIAGGSGGIDINKENAASLSNGDPFWEIPLATSTKVVQATSQRVTLRANVTEQADGTPGDLTKSQVVFELYAGSNLALTPAVTSPASVFYCDPSTSTPKAYAVGAAPPSVSPAADGSVSCSVDLPEDTWTVVVKLLDSNGYYQGSAAEPYVVTVYIPTLDYYTAGGGWYTIPSAAWTSRIALSPSTSRAFFGFSVKYANSKRTTPAGKVQYQFHGADGFIYQMKMTTWTCGGAPSTMSCGGLTFTRVNASQNKATFGGKCILNKIDRATGLVVFTYSNGTCRFDVTDNATTFDTMAVTMLDSANLVLFRSGTLQSQLSITGGGVRVKMPLK